MNSPHRSGIVVGRSRARTSAKAKRPSQAATRRPVPSHPLLALALTCGLALLLVPAIAAIPPYIALEYLGIGGACVAVVLARLMGGAIRDLPKLVGFAAMPTIARREPTARLRAG
jgi:hypothetical protein